MFSLAFFHRNFLFALPVERRPAPEGGSRQNEVIGVFVKNEQNLKIASAYGRA
jgi:hypothetical protein